MSNCWETGGPGWLFPFALSSGSVAVFAGLLFLVVQRDARFGQFERVDEYGRRRWAAGIVAGSMTLVMISAMRDGPGEPWMSLAEVGIPAAAAAVTIRCARRQVVGVPAGCPLPWRAVRGAARWSLPVVAALALLSAYWAIVAMFALGHAC